MRGFMCPTVLMIVLVGATGAVAEEDTEKRLGTVVVTATRTEKPLESATQSISVVSGDEMQSRQTTTVTEALRDVPGVDVSQPGSPGTATSVFIRGAESDQTLFLVDGVKVNSPMLGGFNLGNIMTDDLTRIEVLRSAGGTLYGSDAVGGVVNMMAKKGEGAPQLSIASAGGNIGTASELATLSGQSGIVAYSTSLGYLTTGGFRPINDDFSVLTHAGRVDVTPIEHGTLRAFWRVANSTLGLANNNIGSGLNLLDPDARERDEFYLGKGEWEHQLGPNLTYRISGAYSRTVNVTADAANTVEQSACDARFPQFHDPLSCFSAYFRSPSYIASGEGQVNYTEGTLGISTLGLDFKSESGAFKLVPAEITPFSAVTRFAHTRHNIAGYAQQQLFFLDNKLSAVGGVRVDGNQDFGREVSASWSVGYVQDWADDGQWTTHVKGGYAEGFKAPTFNQLFFPGFGNPDLDPELSSEYDGGASQHLGFRWLSVEGTYFARRTKNLIRSAQTAARTSVTANAARADVSGPEATVALGPVFGLSLRGTYSYLDWGIVERPELSLRPPAKTFERRPHNRMATTVNYAGDGLVRAADHLDANVNVILVGERHDLDPLTFQDVSNQPMYVRTDLAVRYDLPMPGHEAHRVGWFARVQNLFDRNYQEVRGFKSPPINVLAGAEVTF
jgi:vitamin B12 transporter